LRPLVAHLAGTAAEHTGPVTFHHRTAVTTGAGAWPWRGGTVAVQARPIEQVESLLGGRIGGRGARVWGMPTVRIPRACRRRPNQRCRAHRRAHPARGSPLVCLCG
jgi:hypothetical protein